jgi:hypothetical protein
VSKISIRIGRAVVGTAGIVGMVALGTGPAMADAAVHDSFPVSGTVPCGDTSYTAVAGTVEIVTQTNESASGISTITGTITPHDVTLADAAGNVYTLVGARQFASTSASPGEPIQFTAIEKLQIIAQGGGVVGTVNTVMHLSPSGNVIDFNFGNCA